MRKAPLNLWPVAWLLAMMGAWSLAAVAADAPSADSPAANAAARAPATAKCQEAIVNPVSGYAECVKPRGAPVAPPPKRPDAVPDAGRTEADKAR
jgi:hypothetical protein